MLQFNEKPSAHSNIGVDVKGSRRHNFDTYETLEEAKEKVVKKATVISVKKLTEEYKIKLIQAILESNEAAQDVLKDYELKKGLLASGLFSDQVIIDVKALRSLVLEVSDFYKKEVARKVYNRIAGKINKIKYLSDIKLNNYFEPKTKNSFTEYNGIKKEWSLSDDFEVSSIDHLKEAVRAIQFGNSIPASEREYCFKNLSESLKVIEKHLSFDFKTIAFAFGARGLAGSIAHYQDTERVIAINRSWDGALIHEIGHAIDYSLGRASSLLPFSIRDNYRLKLRKNAVQNQKYYLKPVEIFARLFEVYFRYIEPLTSNYMQTTFSESVMPDLDHQSLIYMKRCLEPYEATT